MEIVGQEVKNLAFKIHFIEEIARLCSTLILIFGCCVAGLQMPGYVLDDKRKITSKNPGREKKRVNISLSTKAT